MEQLSMSSQILNSGAGVYSGSLGKLWGWFSCVREEQTCNM